LLILRSFAWRHPSRRRRPICAAVTAGRCSSATAPSAIPRTPRSPSSSRSSNIVTAGRRAGRGVADADAVQRSIASAGLGEDQAAAVRAVTLDGHAVACVVGPAGTGKSRTMRAAADAWQASGVPVRGLAVSAVAAGVLHAEAGVPADTVAKLLFEHDRPGAGNDGWRLRRGEVVVVDEASMVASRDLARLAQLAHRAEAKLVLVGDYAQLGAVEARDPAVIVEYDRRGRVTSCNRLGALDAAFTAWHDARSVGAPVVICATDNATVADIARRIRAARVAAGEVEPAGITAAHGQSVGVGDDIVTTRNDRRLMTSAGGWVRNGDRWTVTARHGDGSITVSHFAGHGRVLLPTNYANQDVSLAYALTLHRAQGVTVDRAVPIADEATTAEALYVGMTRGRHDNTALVVCDQLDDEHRDTPPMAADVLIATFGRVSAEQAALDALRATLAASESLAVLAPRLANLDAWIVRETPLDPTIELLRLAARRQRIEQHARPGVLTQSRRHDRRLLHGLDQRQRQLEAMADRRAAWLDRHADTLAYRDQLTAQVADRRAALAAYAVSTQPHHLVQLIGPVPQDDAGQERWSRLAGHVEAYREHWGIEPEDIRHPPIDHTQYQDWNAAVKTVQMIERINQPHQDHRLQRGLGIEL
jgi:AAA domain